MGRLTENCYEMSFLKVSLLIFSPDLFVSIAEDLLQVLELCSKSMNTKDVETTQKRIAFQSNINNTFVDIETRSILVETEYGCNVFTSTVDKSPR